MGGGHGQAAARSDGEYKNFSEASRLKSNIESKGTKGEQEIHERVNCEIIMGLTDSTT